jgi:hypothetical protein
VPCCITRRPKPGSDQCGLCRKFSEDRATSRLLKKLVVRSNFSMFPMAANGEMGVKYFAGQLVDYYDAEERDAAHRRLTGENCPSESWQWSWASLKPLHFTECPLYSPLIHAVSATKQQPRDLVTLKPGAWGMNVDLVELARRCRPWLKRSFRRSSS